MRKSYHVIVDSITPPKPKVSQRSQDRFWRARPAMIAHGAQREPSAEKSRKYSFPVFLAACGLVLAAAVWVSAAMFVQHARRSAEDRLSAVAVALLPGGEGINLEQLEAALARLARARAIVRWSLGAALGPSAPHIAGALDVIVREPERILDAAGARGPRVYLVAFQNPSELRATGGFIGSFGIVRVNQGRIAPIEVKDVFDHDWGLAKNIIPPMPLQDITAAWSLHDANWFFDFPTSAQKIAYFYELGGGGTLDGVIAVTPRIAEELLRLTGPITLSSYPDPIDAENFVEAIQQEVEEGAGKQTGEPKRILVELVPKIFEAFRDERQAGDAEKDEYAQHLLPTFISAVESKDIQVWLRSAVLQDFVLAVDAGGAIAVQEPNVDYLAIVHSNINGYKTDRVMNEEIVHEARPALRDGAIIDTVTITRVHTGGDKPQDYYNQVNKDYARIYVPQGSKLVSAEGFTDDPYEPPEVYRTFPFVNDPLVKHIEHGLVHDTRNRVDVFEESGKTVFGGWVFVSPKERVTVRITYNLPDAIRDAAARGDYRFLFDRQAGTDPYFAHNGPNDLPGDR